MKLFSRIISTGLGTGYSPVAPGTAGALFILIIYWLIPLMSFFVLSGVIVILFILGVVTSTQTEEEMISRFGSEKGHDASMIVIDEIVGMLIALLAVPKQLSFVIAAFILFRIFDIAKPFPINRCQNFPRGWGIMLDDVVAGIFANILIQLYLLTFYNPTYS